jgi:hypothetical protein
MAKLTSLIGLPGGAKRQLNSTLAGLERSKTPLRFEIENTNTRFFSVVSVRRGMVVVAKPPGLKEGITRESFVRFKVPGKEGKEVRLEVTVPHFNLMSGSYVFLCKMPAAFADSAKRKYERYNTSRFSNLHLVLPEPQFRLRIIDISEHGCKTYTQSIKFNGRLQLGSPYHPATISVGGRVDIDLDAAIPRSQQKSTLGFEFKVHPDGTSGKYLAHFLQSLEKGETEKMRSTPE